MQIRLVDRQILPRSDAFLQRAVDPDLVLVRLAANLHDRARVGEALEGKRLDPGGLVRLGPAVVDVLAPLLAELLVRNPFLEQAVESLANVECLVLELAPRRPFELLTLELVVQVLVVVDERREFLP